MKKTLVMILLVLSISLLVACSVPEERLCTVAEDCVAAVCCHPDSAVNKDYAPNCAAVLCSAECVPGTLDCNQAEIACVKGACMVVPNE